MTILASFVGSALLIILNLIGTFGLCGGKGYSNCMDTMHDAMLIFVIIIPLFIFSLITYKMKEDVYQTWWKFSRVWIPLSMLMILMAPSYSSNWMIPIEKGTVAFFSSIIYGAISVYIIIYHLSKRK